MSRSEHGPEFEARWCRHIDVLRHLDVDYRTLKRAMNMTPGHIERPWVNVGTSGAPQYRWDSRAVDRWWREVQAWRASDNEVTGTRSGGATQTGASVVGKRRTTRRRSASNATSSERPRKATGGNLVTLVRDLTSTKS